MMDEVWFHLNGYMNLEHKLAIVSGYKLAEYM
jgi:hypothetical protein